jgi:hypothetical protein
MTEKTAVAGLARLTGWMFIPWGGLVAVKGVYDAFLGQPEANFYSPHPWEFVTRAQWIRWSGFELTYGLACIAVGVAARVYARRLPEFVIKEKKVNEIL